MMFSDLMSTVLCTEAGLVRGKPAPKHCTEFPGRVPDYILRGARDAQHTVHAFDELSRNEFRFPLRNAILRLKTVRQRFG